MVRIVSLLPSATEIVCALGLDEHLVGRSHECDFPRSIARLPICTRPKFAADGRSYEIHQRVLAILQEALGIYHIDAARLEALQPSHIITQTQCEVCAVSRTELEQAAGHLISSRPELIALSPDSLDQVWQDIRLLGRVLGAGTRAETLVSDMQGRMAEIARRAAGGNVRPTLACIEWIEPLMAAGNWMPDLVAMAGAVNLFGRAGHHSPWLAWDDLVAGDPDIILVMPCGFTLARAFAEARALADAHAWRQLRAVREGRVFVADGHQYFNRPGPRLVDSLQILAEVCHPEVSGQGHETRGWVRLPGP